ncbi:unnamed protein product [Cylicocyclus nassatus]|uniref:Uncharacterized protein n=1 Tax=Cylicocyclus nassatus TaxID=53992 RepID=A0AA36GV08_CYLNA|nr:unnamed protein product [Cylicocyclus nassatus]
MSSVGSMLRKVESKNLDPKHVTFACPSSVSMCKQHGKKSKSDQRKRQTHQQSGKEKKTKYSEQSAQLLQNEELLCELEHNSKIMEEKIRANRVLAAEALNGMGDLICQFAEVDNKSNFLEEKISELENVKFSHTEPEELDHLVETVEKRVNDYTEFDCFLSNLADRMGEASDTGDSVQLFYEALPTVEKMLTGLSL